MHKKVRVRFAPSPTGYLHVGSVRVAIFNWLFAKHYAGKYLLRIEDTDLQRSKQEYTDSIVDSLQWFGIVSDEEPIIQSSRIEEHKKVAYSLIEKNFAYPCFCDVVESDDSTESIVGREICSCGSKLFTKEGLKKPHAIRFRIPKIDGEISFDDAIRGKISVKYDQLNDFVIIRKDGIPTYNFAVVLDDLFMEITHVIRGDDHISNTPKQILIYKALNSEHPVFAHLPLILNKEGKRLSKRDTVVSVVEYKKEGFLADALFNYLVRLGWSHGDQEIFTKEEMIKYFDLDKVGKSGGVFDLKKLEWLNGFYIRESSSDSLKVAIKEMSADLFEKLNSLWNEKQLERLFIEYKQRATNLKDMANSMIAFAFDPKELDLNLISKWMKPSTKDLMKKYIEAVKELKRFEHDSLLECGKKFTEEFNLKLTDLAQPVRLGLTGSIVSPGIFELMSVLGKEKSISRLEFLFKKL